MSLQQEEIEMTAVATAVEVQNEEPEANAPGPEQEKARTPLRELQPGMELQGVVCSLQPYGAFVDVGAERDGLLHISQLGEGFVQRVEDVLHIGQDITVWVRDVDEQRGRIRLTMRMPGQTLAPRRKLGDLIEGEEMEGRVASVTQFGAFVDIGAETDGLIHVSQLSNTRVDHPADVVTRGERIRVRVLSVDMERRRIGLSMKAVDRRSEQRSPMPADQTDDDLPTVVEVAFRAAQASRDPAEAA